MPSDGLGRVLSKDDFNPDKFVKTIAQGGEDDLLDLRRKVIILADDTAVALKKNVYKNYSQFIETAKEISILEGEMYSLSHTLSEHKMLLSEMKDMSLMSDKVQPQKINDDETLGDESRNNAASLLESVEGCSRVTEVPGRTLVHHGDLVELDPESYTVIDRIHVYLLNDCVMFATLLPQRKGPVKFKFQTLYELDSLAIVNARDIRQIMTNAFKILMFPDTRMLQCDSPKEKILWLDILEETKKKKACIDNQKRESVFAALDQQVDATANPSIDDLNSFSMSNVSDLSLLHEDWVQDMPEDLDVFIAQRDFENAVEKINEVEEYLKLVPKSSALTEFRARIEHRVKHLTDVLVQELQVSPERSMRGGPRAARRAVTQLINLGKSAQACELFLENRQAIISYNLKQLKLEGAVTLFIKKLSDVFFSSLTDTGYEFLKAFPDHYGCYSEFVVWCGSQLAHFVELFSSQVLLCDSKTVSLSTVADCVNIARKHCGQLEKLGLEMMFSLDNLLCIDVQRVILEQRNQLLEAAKRRAADDNWRPVNLSSHEDGDKLLTELEEVGLTISEFIDNDKLLSLTTNTTQFSRSFLIYVDDVCKLYMEPLHCTIIDSLAEVLKFQLKHVERALTAQQFFKEHSFILKNGGFIVDLVLRKTEEKLSVRTGHHSYQFYQIYAAYKRIKQNAAQKV